MKRIFSVAKLHEKYFHTAMKCASVCMIFYLVTTSLQAAAQDSAKKKDIDELRLKLNDDGSHYLKFNVLGHLWFRFNESNPGTTVLKEPAHSTFDIGIRRLRFQFYGQLTDHAFFYLHFGQDNFNYLAPRKFTPFIQDVIGEYKVKKKSDLLIFGGGLSIVSGLSRFTQPQLANIVLMDLPVFVFPTFELTDQAGRKLGIYARGQVKKLNYRFSISNPFPVITSGTNIPAGNPVTPISNFAPQSHHKQYEGLFIWNFLETEPHILPFTAGTYYGRKKVLNLESGFITQKKATWSSSDGGQTVNYHALKCWSVALFYDAPLNKKKGTALNAYIGYFDTRYGPGYLRYIGPMNPADGPAPSANQFPGSHGNASPMNGHGNVIYSQLGYLLNKDLFWEGKGTLMPYATVQTAKYDRLDKRMTIFNLGINYFHKKNHSKLSLDYQNRPVYTLAGNNLIRDSHRKGQFVLQHQFFF